ncbi:MAG: CRISPR-associated endonuclease Cas2 [Planctomycetes bacterium]|nr:CRISPR-associated endonuclease Cas2 [Planctomycetota bacterium]
MWVFAMFDLPVDSKEARREYTTFRKELLRQGFSMLQYSIYARFCRSEESSEIFRKRLRAVLPPEGHVRLLGVTDRQFGKMDVYIGKKREKPEAPPRQIQLF